MKIGQKEITTNESRGSLRVETELLCIQVNNTLLDWGGKRAISDYCRCQKDVDSRCRWCGLVMVINTARRVEELAMSDDRETE